MSNYQLQQQQMQTMTQRWALRMLRLLGWNVNYKPLPGPRGVIIVYPHTSNWDFMVGVLAKLAIGMPFYFIAKSSLFEGVTGATIGRLVRYLGGEPVERGVSTGAISRLADKMHAADWYWMALAPEGSRSLKPYWRSGFYHIAVAANVPLGCAYFDFRKREVSLVDYLDLSGDTQQDMQHIRDIYRDVQGCRPQLASPIQLRTDEEVKN
ncbi:1-acyl-sn-glycerol-3-phosphate acyltransferase [Undibacterium oligocarboniphilum]|uniref:1-acyl-sn-glycerol-3-phosphate acyltransferase n=1 Tax=Undibacterium oligocarboniphilum TaxID=666702 RepID=A0A850QHH5_9BURK|nr:1-acyl-sn-glycerol-3-phosphate acyltransferase [Undibacterium oligocarboniphilum]MBC3870461.1 1-acyl-sn-glycerol-3-phosphate acyltransferase [Undibacterium oligocarboniphilum]NVO78738.1 1-acyl-sn-glycerol-3-phosphate acyltransferase [Undibacterium oligocarboniphilum]